MQLIDKIISRQAKVTVIGLGYVGLPLAVEFARSGLRVAGFDVDYQKISSLRRKESYIQDVPSDHLAPLIESERFVPSENPKYIHLADAIVICVPTPCHEGYEPDLSFVESAAKTVATQLRPGQLVILESTSFPGTTEEFMQPILEASGLRAGEDFYLAFSPERIDPGNPFFNLKNTPKIVAGVTEEATLVAEELYRCVADRVLRASSPRVAEMTKLYENTFRHINIAFANEMAQLCDRIGIDIWEVIHAASSKPFGFMPFFPGPGVGGHCIPIDPQYLVYKAKQYDCHLKFVELANEVNRQMPLRVVDKVESGLSDKNIKLENARVLVLGVAYKKDIDDVRESPAIEVIENLIAKGAEVRYHDPLVPEFRYGPRTLNSVPLTCEELQGTDCVVICTDHSTLPYDMIADNCNLIVDTRNAIKRLQDLKLTERV